VPGKSARRSSRGSQPSADLARERNGAAAIAHLYDPEAATDAAVALAEFVASRFGGTPAVGDRTRFGAVELIVRDMQGDTITQVGVELDPTPKHRWRPWLRLLYWRLG